MCFVNHGLPWGRTLLVHTISCNPSFNRMTINEKVRRNTTSWPLRGIVVIFLSGLSGCAITPVPLTTDEVQSRVKEDRAVLTKDQEPLSGPMDLYDAMARALKYNLEARVELMHKMLSQAQLDLSHYAMLPRLAVNAGFDGRSNFTGGRGMSLVTGRQAIEPFTSSEKNIFSEDLSLSWNVLDFGLSYIRAKQAADDVLIADEERRRVANRVRGGSGNSDSVVSGSLASPMSPRGGEPEEQGDEENETESRSDLQGPGGVGGRQ
ncbi:MAG: TolC family protein, partial [Nitrospira sp.]|nr:TolC family protein [Nitrospira sp.]